MIGDTKIHAKQIQGQSTICMSKLDFESQEIVGHIHEFMLKSDGLITNWNVLYQEFEKKYGKLKLKIADKEKLFSSIPPVNSRKISMFKRLRHFYLWIEPDQVRVAIFDRLANLFKIGTVPTSVKEIKHAYELVYGYNLEATDKQIQQIFNMNSSFKAETVKQSLKRRDSKDTKNDSNLSILNAVSMRSNPELNVGSLKTSEDKSFLHPCPVATYEFVLPFVVPNVQNNDLQSVELKSQAAQDLRAAINQGQAYNPCDWARLDFEIPSLFEPLWFTENRPSFIRSSSTSNSLNDIEVPWDFNWDYGL
eukprot:NODE_468_length_8097_cov_0.251813.p4 type:complete len:307 gc:universal NODE_468_length_8097_cov_0.251813:6061-5141(-)